MVACLSTAIGLAYDEMVDMWSVGCVLFELFTGKILFQGKDNNAMLELFQQYKGHLPNKMIKQGQFSEEHFTPDMQFQRKRTDEHSGMVCTITVLESPPACEGHVLCCDCSVWSCVTGIDRRKALRATRDQCAQRVIVLC